MDAERWSLIQRLFEAALEKEPSYRITFLQEACEADVELYREVSSLLAADQQLNSLIDGQALDAITYVDGAISESELENGRIGPYNIVREIGRGGMGIVYLADRADGQFEQAVALKLIKRGMDSELIVRRFVRERQILAHLQHPNIAHLLDGGISSSGRPYFAMEYVEGESLTSYCNSRRYSIEQRLYLIQQVCEAVQYAHRNLVVHRDLKPGNILVSGQDKVKLLDFGIARMLDGDPGGPGNTLYTEAGMRVLTPEYAAPEQVRGESITTQTDLYALGVILYELLAGVRPLKITSHAPAEVEAVVCHQIPPRASTRVLDVDTIEETHALPSRRLYRQLKGDLDTICEKALHKEPGRRYSSAYELGEDIQRYLDGLPVLAQRDSLAYRTRKFVARNRASVIAAASFVVLLGFVVALYTVRLGYERDRAQQEAEKAEQTAGFLASLFEASNPTIAQGDTLNAREILDIGSARIQDELVDQPEVQAELLTVIGDAYQSLGLYTSAEEHFKSALNNFTQLGDTLSAETASLWQSIADIRHSLSDFSAADSSQQRALAIQEAIYGEEHPEIAQTLLKMASTNRALGNYEAAFPLYRKAVAINENTLPKDDPELGWSINNLGWALHSRGYYEEAEETYRKAETLQREYLGETHPDLAFTLNNLGGLLWTTGRFEEGESLVRESLEIRRTLYGDEHPETVQSLNNLAGLLFRKGDMEAAEPIYKKTVEVNTNMLGEKHRYVASGLSSLGTIQLKRGLYDEAEAYQLQALAIREELFGGSHRLVAISKSNLGHVYRYKGDPARAEKAYQEALDFWRTLDTKPIEMAYPLVGLGRVWTEDNRAQQAQSVLREAVDLRSEFLDEDDPLLAETRAALGRCLLVLGESGQGELLIRGALQILEETDNPEAFDIERIRAWLPS